MSEESFDRKPIRSRILLEAMSWPGTPWQQPACVVAFATTSTHTESAEMERFSLAFGPGFLAEAPRWGG